MGAQWAETDSESRTEDVCSHEVPDVIDCDVHPQLPDGLVETVSLEVGASCRQMRSSSGSRRGAAARPAFADAAAVAHIVQRGKGWTT
jgi:hypothetical protein